VLKPVVFTMGMILAMFIATETAAQPAWVAPPQITGVNDAQLRQEMSREDAARGRRRDAAPPTAAQNLAAAQTIATSAGLACQVTEANLLGETADGAATYEAACAAGPGYILVSTTPPQSMDCILLAGQAEMDRAANATADVGVQCAIAQNLDALRVVSAYAAEAGVPCAADQGAFVTRVGDNPVYEVGCAGADGYWIESQAAGWKKTECSVVLTLNGACRFSTTAEQAATLKSRLADTEAASCDVTESRFMGSSGGSSFYEAKCGAGNGMIVRFSASFGVQQIFPCEAAQGIGGGCRLTAAPAAGALTTTL
jgi:hypothetical protein